MIPLQNMSQLENNEMKRTLLAAAGIAAIACPVQAAQELPKRKPGLWEIRNEMQGHGMAMPPMQMCTDEKTDNLMQQQASGMKQDCSVMDWKRDGDRVTINSVCKASKDMTVTTKAVFTGDLNSNYRGDLEISYDPPVTGRKNMKMTIFAKWLGPCKKGQKPGDMIMPNMTPGKNMPNMQELMKMRDRMKSMQGEE
jgi:hypothetical protein